MGKKRKVDVTKANEANKNGEVTSETKDKMSPPATKKKKDQKDYDSDNESDVSTLLDTSLKRENSNDFEDDPPLDLILPPKEDLQILLNRIELQLPKDDHVKYDSRARKLDWDQIKFKDFSAEDCKRYWEHVQARIRRFRILAEMIPDARQWLSQPWTNFYKSKDHNRHPEMPKKPLSMYMLYYSERREDIQKEHPHLSMPDVAKICSDEYQKLPEKRKARYKSRCDDMRREYDIKLDNFYTMYPELRPIKTEKAAKTLAHKTNMVRAAEPEKPVILLPGAPQKPGKPFDLYFQQQLECQPDAGTERGVLLERARQDWRDMKVKKKAKWIRKAMKEFREYEEQVVDFKSKHPEFNPPSVKSFLTQEEQKILDKYMGRPEKPPSSAYSLFSKEMLNTEFIKQFPSKERMSHISEAWKKVSDADKEIYQTQVNEAMTKYKSEYNEWYEALTAEEQKVEKERTTTKSTKKSQLTPILTPSQLLPQPPMQQQPQQQPQQAQQQPPQQQPQQIAQPQQQMYQTMPTPMQHQPLQQQNLQNLQMPAITVPYPNITANQQGQPMFVKVEVVGAPGTQTHVTHAQIMPQMTYNVTQPYTSQASYSTQQPYTMQVGPMVTPQPQPTTQPTVKPEKDRVEVLRAEILRREPVEPARSHKQLFLSDYVKKMRKKDKKSTDQKLLFDGKEIWKVTEKKDKKKWLKMLEPQRQRYIEAYTIFVRGLNKEELELYTEMKARRDAEDEAKRATESSDEEESDTSDDESDTDSDSGSDSDI